MGSFRSRGALPNLEATSWTRRGHLDKRGALSDLEKVLLILDGPLGPSHDFLVQSLSFTLVFQLLLFIFNTLAA